MATLDLAVTELPDSHWWIKSDSCDVVSSLMESTWNQWNGDVDIGDGDVQKQHNEYCKRLEFIEDLSNHVHDQCSLGSCLQRLRSQLVEDGVFVDSGM